MENKDYTNIPIPDVVINKIREHIKNTEFKSVSEYIIFILREILEDKDDKSGLTQEEEEQVKATLRKLGYL